MNVQNINNQQPQFGRVARLKVNSIFLPDIKIDDTFWKGMNNPPFHFKINETPDEKGLFDVTIFGGKENRLINKVENKYAREIRRVKKRLQRVWWRLEFNELTDTQKALKIEKETKKETLMKTLEEKAPAPIEVKSSLDVCKIPGFQNYYTA